MKRQQDLAIEFRTKLEEINLIIAEFLKGVGKEGDNYLYITRDLRENYPQQITAFKASCEEKIRELIEILEKESTIEERKLRILNQLKEVIAIVLKEGDRHSYGRSPYFGSMVKSIELSHDQKNLKSPIEHMLSYNYPWDVVGVCEHIQNEDWIRDKVKLHESRMKFLKFMEKLVKAASNFER